MSLTHSIAVTWSSLGDVPITGTITTSDSSEQNMDIALTTSEADHECAIAFAKADLKSLFILADQDAHFHSNATDGAQEITLKAGVPWLWTYASGIAVPFAADITALFATNEYAGANTIRFRAILDEG